MATPTIATSLSQVFGARGTGNPSAANNQVAAVWTIDRGGAVVTNFSAEDKDLVVTLQTSNDGSTWATASVESGSAANLSVPARVTRTLNLLVREGQDKYLRLLASGGGRGEIQLHSGAFTPLPGSSV